mgnify:CR=1 FL=1
MNHNNNRRSMKDARKNKKTKKQPTVGRPRKKGTKLRKLLDELHSSEHKQKHTGSNKRAEDILRLIRQRQAQEGLAIGLERIILQQARVASSQFLRQFFDGINGIK